MHYITFVILITSIIIGVLVYYMAKRRYHEQFVLSPIQFSKPGTYPPNNNCYELVSQTSNINLGDNNWDYLKRAKVLSLLVPDKNIMLQTKDTGTILNGTCLVPSEAQSTLGINNNCVLAGQYQLDRDDNTKLCSLSAGNQEQFLKVIDAAYEVYDKDYLAVIANLKEQIRYYTDENNSMTAQIEQLTIDLNKFIAPEKNVVKDLQDYNTGMSIKNQNLNNCIIATGNAIATNEILLNKVSISITTNQTKIQKVQDMLNIYKPHGSRIPLPPPPPPPPPPVEPQITQTCTPARTDWQTVGKGRTNFLDRYQFNCGDNQLLSRFVLELNPDKSQGRYMYTCCTVQGQPTNIVAHRVYGRETQWDKPGKKSAKWSARYLDRHNVDCGNDYIKSIVVEPHYGTEEKIRYNYQCSSLTSTDNNKSIKNKCQSKSTEWKKESDSFTYFDEHDVQCNSDEAITQFKLQRNKKGKFRYNYTCCKPSLAPVPPPPPPRIPPAKKTFQSNIQQTAYGDVADCQCTL